MAVFTVTNMNNNFTGTALADTFRGFSGGTDILRGMAGNDRFSIQDWNSQRGRVDGGTGIDRITMIGHNNHTFLPTLVIVGVEELWADEPNLYANATQLNQFSKFVPTNDEPWWAINITGNGGTVDFTGKYTSTKTLEIRGDMSDAKVVVTGSGKSDEFSGSEFNDVWVGGAGADEATGNGGNDAFRFRNISESTVAAPDRILDFFGHDKINVSALFGPALVYRGTAPFTKVGQLKIVDVVGPDVVVQVNTVGGLGADFAIRLVDVTLAEITKTDFIL
ncbi:MAG TPA: M10 family metallopeptidase C-terminal domain-containing protein [Rhizobiaceae bacterium]|nr:M10 family metallopeptidase C-terminal domain-containing protein [Rhizobiaceae bacterium]